MAQTRWRKREALACGEGSMHLRRTVGLAIPCRVASPQSSTPFHQAGKFSIKTSISKIFLDERRASIEGCVKRKRSRTTSGRDRVRLRFACHTLPVLPPPHALHSTAPSHSFCRRGSSAAL